MADKYADEDWQKKMLEQTREALLKHLDWIGVDWARHDSTHTSENASKKGKEVSILDYACGPGSVSAVRIVLTTHTAE